MSSKISINLIKEALLWTLKGKARWEQPRMMRRKWLKQIKRNTGSHLGRSNKICPAEGLMGMSTYTCSVKWSSEHSSVQRLHCMILLVSTKNRALRTGPIQEVCNSWPSHQIWQTLLADNRKQIFCACMLNWSCPIGLWLLGTRMLN